MNFKPKCLLIAVATIAAVASINSKPVQAANLSGQLDLDGLADADPSSIDFSELDGTADALAGELEVSFGTGDFSGLAIGTVGIVKDLSTIPLPAPVAKWLDFSDDTFDFDLDAITNTSNLSYDFSGRFTDGTFATGSLTTQITGTGTKSYSVTITAETAPTPALLPGLLGFGATLMRKRKQSGQDSLEGMTKAA